ncbi:hypothetical protein FB45DRAFT_205743 [Roridomyces roridus]|uniref:N-acetyltransferase domain-containing protein n=1 Tax=Roridomyces roridus TaxID=1738132 RepID=A0AAD7FZH9_9AGAR|nr:hypothetical protein FB45DRAFT_205743 [Roridomyces roridus]
MSAYGALSKPQSDDTLSTSFWHLRGSAFVTVHHLTLAAAKSLDGLIEHLGEIMVKVVEEGRTYPQETMQLDTFEAYFFSADVFLAILPASGSGGPEGSETPLTVKEAQQGRAWDDCVVGFYYVKPNYPGRSSHICNGGFVVPPRHRGGGYGSTLAKSYVQNAPKLGYRGSVFNLVYTNNAASVKLWERLDFKKAGLIPKAGRLRREDGAGEEYVDAWVFYKSFVDEDESA